jgi:hypothetical protein
LLERKAIENVFLEVGGTEGRRLAAELEPLIGGVFDYEKLWKADLDSFARESETLKKGTFPDRRKLTQETKNTPALRHQHNDGGFTDDLDPRVSTVDLPGAQQTSFSVLAKNSESVQKMESVGKMTVQMFYLKQLYNPDSELFSHLETVYQNVEEEAQQSGFSDEEKQRQSYELEKDRFSKQKFGKLNTGFELLDDGDVVFNNTEGSLNIGGLNRGVAPSAREVSADNIYSMRTVR